MDSASILVLVLCVGGFALLVWFEMNSRANTAKKVRRCGYASKTNWAQDG
jgi:hypothetical protein